MTSPPDLFATEPAEPSVDEIIRTRRTWIRRLACRILGHRLDLEMRFVDSHGGDDGLAVCSRCGCFG